MTTRIKVVAIWMVVLLLVQLVEPTTRASKGKKKAISRARIAKAKNIALNGLALVNGGNFERSFEVFAEALKVHNECAEALVGRGTAFALTHRFQEALDDFTVAIESKSTKKDDLYLTLVRRSQVYKTIGQLDKAFADANRVVKLKRTADSLALRGNILWTMSEYIAAVEDLEGSVNLDVDSQPQQELYANLNVLGLAYNKLGEYDKALDTFARATEVDGESTAAFQNKAISLAELARVDEAQAALDIVERIAPRDAGKFQLQGMVLYGEGRYEEAAEAFRQCLAREDKRVCHTYLSKAYSAMFQFKLAREENQKLISGSPNKHEEWEGYCFDFCSRMTCSLLDKRVDELNFDQALPVEVRTAFSKHTAQPYLSSIRQLRAKYLPPRLPVSHVSISPERTSNPDFVSLLTYAHQKISTGFFQVKERGFSFNTRQHKQASLAVIDVAQHVASFWNGDLGWINGKASSWTDQAHSLQWRDVFDVAVKWRQFSEPGDPVFWVDRLDETVHREIGAHTCMLCNGAKNARYYTYNDFAFRVLQGLIPKFGTLDAPTLREIQSMQPHEHDRLYNKIGGRFFVIIPCVSYIDNSVELDGTMLEMTRNSQSMIGHVDFSIRTMLTQERWIKFDAELQAIWDDITKEITSPNPDEQKIKDLVFTLTYFWFVFMPLTRGTAGVGIVVCFGILLAAGWDVQQGLPYQTQVDWEALLRSDYREYVSFMNDLTDSMLVRSNSLEDIPNVSATLPTLRHMLEALLA